MCKEPLYDVAKRRQPPLRELRPHLSDDKTLEAWGAVTEGWIFNSSHPSRSNKLPTEFVDELKEFLGVIACVSQEQCPRDSGGKTPNE